MYSSLCYFYLTLAIESQRYALFSLVIVIPFHFFLILLVSLSMVREKCPMWCLFITVLITVPCGVYLLLS